MTRLCLVSLLLLGTAAASYGHDAAPEAEAPEPVVLEFPLVQNYADAGEERADGYRTAKGWVVSDFSGGAEVRVVDDTVVLTKGDDLTGIRWTGPLIRMNYEITLKAKRVDGNDFFCGLTFPYNDDCASFIVGGWGGTVCGISSLDYFDAYNNETSRFVSFETDRWYDIRVRVTGGRIQAWIDEDQLVDVSTKGRKVDIRFEVTPSKPLGIATWRTTGAITDVRIRKLTPEEIEAAAG